MSIRLTVYLSASLAGLLASMPALAQDKQPQPNATIMNDTDLAAARGGQTVIVNRQTFAATTTGGAIGSYSAGPISISDNALSGFAGIGNFVINSGAQNNLQAGMTVTININ